MLLVMSAFLMITTVPFSSGRAGGQDEAHGQPAVIPLPAPTKDGKTSLEQALLKRHSVREYAPTALTLAELSQLCWAAQGITRADGRRSSPSAGALYPMELLVVAENVQGLDPGIYRYRVSDHSLVPIRRAHVRTELAEAALGQGCVRQAPVTFVLSAVASVTTKKYGERGIRYIHMEAGHAAQNLALQAVALGLGSVTVGAFRDSEVNRILGLGKEEESLYLLPVGHPAP